MAAETRLVPSSRRVAPQDMHVTDMLGEDPIPFKLLTGELLASMGLGGASDDESEEGQGA